jgi:hypothetical protein
MTQEEIARLALLLPRKADRVRAMIAEDAMKAFHRSTPSRSPPTATVKSIEPDAVACRASGNCF